MVPSTMKVQLLERSHDLRSNLLLHISFDLASSPLQQPTSSDVVDGVVVVVVVITQSSGSSVRSHSQPLLSHLLCSIAI